MDTPSKIIWVGGYLFERAAREGSPKYEAPKTSLPKIPEGTVMIFTTCWFDTKEAHKAREETVKCLLINKGMDSEAKE
jgi:hypothetical protein